MTLTGEFSKIPLVDLSPRTGSASARAELAEHLREICHTIGFFIAINHGVDNKVVDSVFDTSRRFFNLPLEKKQLIDKRNSRHFRGWEAVGTELTNNRPDIREQIDLWSEHPPRAKGVKPEYLRLLGPNQWLNDDVLPGFKSNLTLWFEETGKLGEDLMRLFALGLGLAEDHFDIWFGKEPMSLTKLIHYPETPPGQFGVNAHHDTGFLTLLAAGETPGLEVQNGAGEWIAVEPVRDAFVVNLGEMMQGITGNYFVATPHRVATRAERYSVAYFHGPSLQTPLAPLDLRPEYRAAVAASTRHAAAGFMASIEETEAGIGDMKSHHVPGVYGQQLWNYFSRSYPDHVKLHYAQP